MSNIITRNKDDTLLESLITSKTRINLLLKFFLNPDIRAYLRELAFVTGDYASGRDSGLIDLVLVGEIDRSRLVHLIAKIETLIQRKIRTLVVSEAESQKLKARFTEEPFLLLWDNLPVGTPH